MFEALGVGLKLLADLLDDLLLQTLLAQVVPLLDVVDLVPQLLQLVPGYGQVVIQLLLIDL